MASKGKAYVLFVRGLPWTVARAEIGKYFGRFGSIKKCILPFNEEGFHKGFCWIQFKSRRSTDEVLKNSHTLEGAQLQVLKSFPTTEVNTLNTEMD